MSLSTLFQAVLSTPVGYHPLLAIIKGLRNGAVSVKFRNSLETGGPR